MYPLLFDVVITLVAGFLDAVGVTYLSGIFVSFMSGNSIAFGIAVAHDRAGVAIPIISAIASFAGGAFIGALVVDRCKVPARALVLMLETVLVTLSVVLIPHVHGFLAMLPVCLAMGMQNAIPRAVSGVAIGRSFVTGELFGAGRALALATRDRTQLREAAIHAASWCTIVIGAVAGSLSLTRFGMTACLAVAAEIMFVMAVIETLLLFATLRRAPQETLR